MRKLTRREAVLSAAGIGVAAVAGCVSENDEPDAGQGDDTDDGDNDGGSTDDGGDAGDEGTGSDDDGSDPSGTDDDGSEATDRTMEVIGAAITESTGQTRSEGSGESTASVADIATASGNGAGEVEIQGSIPTSTPRYEAVLEKAEIQDGELHVTVGVESTEEEGTAGTQVLGVVTYTATVELENADLLSSFLVEHPESSHGGAWDSNSASAGTGADSESGTDDADDGTGGDY